MSKAKHAVFSPSQSNIWLNCAFMAKMYKEQLVPKQESNQYAVLGTNIHHLAYKILTGKHTFGSVRAGKIYRGTPLSEEDIAACKVYVQYVRKLRQRVGHENITYETRVQYSKELFGTVDCLALVKDTLYVIDYKHGSGVDVDAEHNTQLMLYAFMACQTPHLRGVKKVRIVIVQPRIWGNKPIKIWDTDTEYLNKWYSAVVYDAMRPAKTPKYTSGLHCKYCPNLAKCPKQPEVLGKLAGVDFSDMGENLPIPTNEDALAQALDYAPIIQRWVASLYSEAFHRLQSGQSVPGYKLVRKQARRKWRRDFSADQISSKLIESGLSTPQIMKESLRSFTEIEKISPEAKAEVALLVEKPKEGDLTIVDDADPRAAVTPLLSDFQDIDD